MQNELKIVFQHVFTLIWPYQVKVLLFVPSPNCHLIDKLNFISEFLRFNKLYFLLIKTIMENDSDMSFESIEEVGIAQSTHHQLLIN